MNASTVKSESPETHHKNDDLSFQSLAGDRRLAYSLTEGRTPGVVFMGGFRSDMTGSKAQAVDSLCKKLGRRCLRFDYSGHGRSSGRFEDGTIGGWAQDAIDMLDNLAPGKNVLIGSSMGGWIMLLAALARSESAAGLIGIASAPDFTENLLWDIATPEQKKELREKGMTYIPDCYGEEPYPITYRLIEEGRNHLLLDRAIPLSVPVRLLHGGKDADVPWETSLKLAQCIESSDVTLTLVKDAGHRLSEPYHLELLARAVEELLSKA